MKVVAIGDSVTYGEHVDREKTWCALLGYVNKGVCGDTTRLALERFPGDVQESGADRVLIQFGFNDCNRWMTDRFLPRVSLQAFRANLREMVKRATRFGIVPTLVATYPTLKGSEYETDRYLYNQEIVSGHAGPFVDPALVIDPRRHLMDELHLSVEGHAVFAELLAGVAVA